MITCRELEGHLTAYVDGECDAARAAEVRAHLGECAACRGWERAERIGRDVLRAQAGRLAGVAPAGLRARLSAGARPARRSLVGRAIPLAAAATFVLAAGLLITGFVRPVSALAAGLACDHWKCTHVGPSQSSDDVQVLERDWKAWQGWDLRIPSGRDVSGLTLRGFRRCLSTEGKMAHLLYDRHGEGVSVFVWPDEREFVPGVLEALGHEAVMWKTEGRTYALVARGDRAEIEGMAQALARELARRGRTAD